jgi:hypothetical protein
LLWFKKLSDTFKVINIMMIKAPAAVNYDEYANNPTYE